MSESISKNELEPRSWLGGTKLAIRSITGKEIFQNSVVHIMLWNYDPNNPDNSTQLEHEFPTLDGRYYYETKLISEVSVYYNDMSRYFERNSEGNLSRKPICSWFTYSKTSEAKKRKNWFRKTVRHCVVIPEDCVYKTNQHLIEAVQKAQAIEVRFKVSMMQSEQAKEFVSYLTEHETLDSGQVVLPSLTPLSTIISF